MAPDSLQQATESTQTIGGNFDNPDLRIVLVAMGCALAFSFASELVSWFVIYRHDDYKKQVAEVVELQEKVETMTEKQQFSMGSLSQSQMKAQARKLQVQEDALKSKQSAIMVKKTRGLLMVGVLLVVGMGTLNSWFSGIVAARLPFTPLGMF